MFTICFPNGSSTKLARDFVVHNLLGTPFTSSTIPGRFSLGDYCDDIYPSANQQFLNARVRMYVPLVNLAAPVLQVSCDTLSPIALASYFPLNGTRSVRSGKAVELWANFTAPLMLGATLTGLVQVSRADDESVVLAASIDSPVPGHVRWTASDDLVAGTAYTMSIHLARAVHAISLQSAGTAVLKVYFATARPAAGSRTVDPLNNVEDAVNIRNPASSISLLLMVAAAGLLALLVLRAVRRASIQASIALQPERFARISLVRYAFKHHALGSLIAARSMQPSCTLARAVAVNMVLLSCSSWLIACIIDLRTTLATSTTGASANGVRFNGATILSAALNSLTATVTSYACGVPLLRRGLRSPSSRTRTLSAAGGLLVSLAMCAAAVLLVHARKIAFGGEARFAVTLVSAAVSLALSLALFEPLSAVLIYVFLGVSHERLDSVGARSSALVSNAASGEHELEKTPVS